MLLPLLLLSIPAFLFSQSRVTGIAISGNRNVSEEKILLLMKTRVGDEYNENVVREDLRSLAGTGFFQSVRYETEEKDGIVVKLFVKENPVIGKMQFAGGRTFKTKQLADFLGINKGDILSEVRLLDGIEKIKEKYREKKFYLVEIDYEIEEIENENVQLRLLINEQGLSYVKQIIFEGNSQVPAARLRHLMKVKQRKMPFIKGTFKKDIFDKDIKRIKAYYADNGFLEATAETNVFTDKRDRLLVLKISVDEGKKYRLGEIGFRGNMIFEEKKLRERLALKEKDAVFNRSKADENVRNLNKFYMDQGYLRVRIDEIPAAGEKPEAMDIIYLVEPDEIYHAGEVIIRGNTKTKDKVIRREVKIEPGDKLTADGIQKSYNRLFDLNYFEKMNIYPEFTESGNTANMVVEVEEKSKTGMFMIGGGYSSVDDIVGVINVQQSNFNLSGKPSFVGGGQNLSTTVQFGTETSNFSVSFTEPYFFDKPVWFGVDLYRTSRKYTMYDVDRTGGALRIGRRWERASLGLTGKIEEIGLSGIEIPSFKQQEGDSRKNSLTGVFTYSSLDRRRASRRGNLAKLSVEYAGEVLGGDIDFVKPVFENDFYYPFGNLIFHSRLFAGMIKELDDTGDIPVYERFFGGGIGTVRGYEERTLGPKDGATGEAIGGRSLFAKSLELIYPIYQEILRGVLFFDAGNVWEDWGEFGSLRKSIGAGVKLVVPVLNAPIEIYYGHALDSKGDEPEGRWHFGMSFGF